MEKPTARYYVTGEGVDCNVFGEALLAAAGLESDDAIREALGEGRFVSVWLNRPNGTHPRAIAQKCRLEDATGWRFDTTLEAAARLEVMILQWTGMPCEPLMENYNLVDLPIADAIEGLIMSKMYPNAQANPFFIAAWRKRQEDLGKAQQEKKQDEAA